LDNNNINLFNIRKKKRVVVAMSGGVDSSVAAAVCAKQGYDVVGVTLQLYTNDNPSQKKGACCAGQDIYDAKKVAEKVGIKHYVLDYEEQFRSEVINEFADSYANGLTPIPCIRCNEKIKFGDLYETAMQLGASSLITGHYVSNKSINGERGLFRARDMNKDQSYFMFTLKKKQLEYIKFPLGDLTKTDTRKIAKELGLATSDKPESQDICFVQNGSYVNLINTLKPKSNVRGNLIDTTGNIVGEHAGIMNFTIGQRRGIGYVNGEPNYVIDIDHERNNVTIGPKEALAINQIFLKNLNWLGPRIGDDGNKEMPVYVKIRSTSEAVPATIIRNKDHAKVKFRHPEYGVAPGQACVIYESQKSMARVLGGGWIIKDKTQNLN
tara:strand:+ start:112 stop:1254 length:1143 start_codon:yes stop_codon:yes gene_type:complete